MGSALADEDDKKVLVGVWLEVSFLLVTVVEAAAALDDVKTGEIEKAGDIDIGAAGAAEDEVIISARVVP